MGFVQGIALYRNSLLLLPTCLVQRYAHNIEAWRPAKKDKSGVDFKALLD